MAKTKAKKKPVATSKKKAQRTPPEGRTEGEVTVTPTPIEEEKVVAEAPVVELVACRYCGASMPKPADGSTFYSDGCVDTGPAPEKPGQ